jgi:hypothetical protein
MLVLDVAVFVDELVRLGPQEADPRIGAIVKARREIGGSVGDFRVGAPQDLEMLGRGWALGDEEGGATSLHGCGANLDVRRHDARGKVEYARRARLRVVVGREDAFWDEGLKLSVGDMRSSKRGVQLNTGGRLKGIVIGLAKYKEVLGMEMDENG